MWVIAVSGWGNMLDHEATIIVRMEPWTAAIAFTISTDRHLLNLIQSLIF